jgi:hypothetical protein
MGKVFSLVFGGFRLLMPLLFNRYFAGHSSLPDVLKAGVFSEICAPFNRQMVSRFPNQTGQLRFRN